MKKTINVSRWECINSNGCLGAIFATLEKAEYHKRGYSYVSRIVELTGSYEIEIPEKRISISESELRATYKNGMSFEYIVKKLFGDNK